MATWPFFMAEIKNYPFVVNFIELDQQLNQLKAYSVYRENKYIIDVSEEVCLQKLYFKC